MRRILVVLSLLPLLVGGARPVIARDRAADAAAAQAAATELFRYAAQRDFNALYDRIHPDAMAVVPRVAAVGAFQEIYGQVQAGQAQITGVDLVSWTWPVTGKTYPYAAAVRFVQPYVDARGQPAQLADTMYLIKAGDGEWRWFFGSSRAFIDQMIAKYGQVGGTPLTQGNLPENVVNDLDAFYRDVVSYTPYTYRSPKVVIVSAGDAARTACGPAESGFWAFYCPGDETVYLDEPLLQQLQQRYPFAAAFVIAHEWAHHVQTAVGIERVDPGQEPTQWNQVYSIELELMADCMAGAWAQDVDTRGLLQPGNIDQAVQFTIDYLGDPRFIGEYDPQAHGSGQQRTDAILSGYQNGFLGCNLTL